MASVDTASDSALAPLLDRIRPAVRDRKPYIVGAPEDADVKLNQNESPYDLPADLKREIADRVMQIPFNRYPSEQPHRLIRALAEYTGHDADGIIVGNGSNELTYTFGMTMIEPGTSVVLPRPMFSLYEKVVRISGGDLVSVGPRNDLSFDTPGLIAAIREADPALTIITSPNNPTGRAMPFEDIARIVEEAAGFVVVDEAYAEFNPEETAQSLMADHPNVILLRTFSKGLGLAGLRVGYLMAHPAIAQEIMKARLPFMTDPIAEAVALAVLERPEMMRERVEKMTASREQLEDELRAMDGVRVVPSRANFVLFETALPAPDLTAQMAEHGVVIRDMSGYDELPHHVRVNAGTPAENKAFLAALEKTLHANHGA